ncbi:hypothetical protein HAX54_048332 [Datura stramonium]|uniref:Uncharacterized protein n=1 Tax=Datura stramonium TaxID=4076 RepID=A0ABS8WL44_DATST|nr:hypothetical protein [Datura stramonium]
MIGFPSSVSSVLNHAELSVTDSDNALIHMDVDQSFYQYQTPVKEAIFESFVRQNIAESEIDVTSNIRQLMESSYGFPTNSKTEFIYADCPLALFSKLTLESCGWDVLEARSGVSVVAKPSTYLGKTVKIGKDSSSWGRQNLMTQISEKLCLRPLICASIFFMDRNSWLLPLYHCLRRW